jgi:hypothetical protein
MNFFAQCDIRKVYLIKNECVITLVIKINGATFEVHVVLNRLRLKYGWSFV